MSSPAQKSAAYKILHGSSDGIQTRTLEALVKNGHAFIDEKGWHLTPRGVKYAKNQLGGALPEVKKAQLREHFKRKPAKAKKARGAAARDRREYEASLKPEGWDDAQEQGRRLARILGPSGHAQAVKVSRADGHFFTSQDLRYFGEDGYHIEAAGSVQARRGASGVIGDAPDVYPNPDPLGPTGEARSVLLLGSFHAADVRQLQHHGLDVMPAPKRYREPVKNPDPVKRAIRKAQAWFGNPRLETDPQEVDWEPPTACVHVGKLVAVEYESIKKDGKSRVYRHSVTRIRQLYISPDGSTFIVDPPLTITKRGIEG